MSEKLRTILACPACKGLLTFSDTACICQACQLVFPVDNGVPILVRDKASNL